MTTEPCADNDLVREVACRRCSRTASLRLGYGGRTGILRSDEAFRCLHCGLIRESDDTGFLQPEPRARMLAAFGTWTVRMGRAQSAFNAVKVLRSALDLELIAAYALLKHEAGIVFTGTKQECEWLKGLLEKAGESPAMSAMTLA
ncbi:hypothetical protein F2P45_02295 [Massilia sp. CCM 8733]|uniref:Uncharacterized protein n=1 Tax=Massilia mucilaginosa TaxID=2609282 RepID=A0ABX0NM55_9BURK|nr:hypothetical protein [Massilia mucilaginosa]NHZ87866.1 hypothetical protein [Massilia mucilaginosa]